MGSKLSKLGPVLDLLGTQFGHLCWCKVVIVVSPNWLYPVPTLFHLVPTIWGHLGPSEPQNTVLDHLYAHGSSNLSMGDSGNRGNRVNRGIVV